MRPLRFSRHVLRGAARAALALLCATSALGQQPPSQAGGARTSQRAAGDVGARLVTTVEGISEYALPNGLKVLLFPDQTKPTVTVNITYLVGSTHEGYGETGMAHLLEHLVFKGSSKHPNIPQELTERGSRPNGTTWYDRTNYFETVPATEAHLEWALDLEADRMVNSFIAKKDLESEFSVVRNELEAGQNSPYNNLLQRTLQTAYLWHGYGRPTIGTRADIEGVPIERLQAFYRRYYQPDNAVLVVAGKLDPDKTLRVIEDKFGRIPKPVRSLENGNLLFRNYTVEPTQDGEREVTVRRVGDAQLVAMVYHTPAGSHPDYAAVDVLTNVLSDNPSGRLYKALVDTKLAASTGAFSFQLRDPSVLFAFAELRLNQNIDSVRAAMARTLDDAARSPFTAEEVERAKTAILKNVELLLNNSERVGFALTEWAAMGDWRLMFLHRDRVEKVTPADVQRVAAAYLKPSNRTVGRFIPTQTPDRAEVPAVPNVAAIVGNYKGRASVAAGEAFDASPKNIDARATRSRLANGAHVTLLPKETRGDRVLAQVVVRHGTEQSLFGKSAVAQLTRDMLSRGTTALTREQVKDSLDKLKARVFFFGPTDYVIANLETTRPNLIPVLDLVTQQLRSPRFDAAEFEKLKQEQLANLEQVKSQPQFVGSVALNRRMNPHPKGHILYSATPDEQIADITAVTLEQVKQFHRDFYGASHADVAAVGDFAADSVRAAAERLFGSWQNAQPYQRVVVPHMRSDSTAEIIQTPDKPNAFFGAGQNLAVRDDDPDFGALALANFMFGSGFLNSRLATRLRQKEGISYGVGSSLYAPPLDRAGFFRAFAIYAPQNADRLVTAFREELDRMLKDGFTAQEIEAAKPGYLQQRLQSRANDNELLSILVARRFAGRTLVYDDELERRIQALTPEQINATVRKYIDPSKIVLVRAGDFVKNPPAKPTP
jgi:zinc protease